MTEQTGLHAAFAEALRGAWRLTARPEQLAPDGDWTTWIFCGGRGAGKTRSGAEWIVERVASGAARFVHLIAPTAGDCRDVLLEGPAGILTIAPTHSRPVYQPSLRKVTWPNGAQALLFSSDEPDRLRGPQCDTLWIDELCAMRTAQDVLDMAYMGLRLGKDPRALITTTPRPIKPFKALLAREGQDVVVTRSSSYANRDNLAPQFFQQIVSKYAGTRLGRQEIEAELLTDVPGALWHLERIEELRVSRAPERLERVVVAVDPAVTFGPDSDETGLIVVGLGADGAGYVLDDASGRYPPEEWARKAIQLYRRYSADRIVAETNQGGDLVEKTLRSVDPSIPFRGVHASRGKMTRAEPVSALYEQGRVHHVGVFGPLEDQLTGYDGSRGSASPDRLDALCWAIHELMLGTPPGGYIKPEALLAPAADSGSGPVEFPEMASGLFAIVSAGIDPDAPDDIAVVIFSYWLHGEGRAPIVVLDWEVDTLSPDLMHAWAPAVAERLAELRQQIKVPGSGSPIAIEPQGVGLTLYQAAQHAHPVELLGTSSAEQELAQMPLPQRVLSASGHVNAGRVRISRHAHEKMTTHRGVTRNHLLQAIAAFGVAGAEQQRVGALLAAFADGVLETFVDPRMRV
ncbi:MAG: DNA-packaging protein [Steroidobacteraceae bacterium]